MDGLDGWMEISGWLKLLKLHAHEHNGGRVSEATIPLLINLTPNFCKLCHKMRLVLHTLEYSSENEVVSINIVPKSTFEIFAIKTINVLFYFESR